MPQSQGEQQHQPAAKNMVFFVSGHFGYHVPVAAL